jgi:uncharacterized protein (TIRG00374 family)
LAQKRYISFFIKLAIGLMIFAIIIWKIGPSRIAANFMSFKIAYVIFIFIIYPLTYVIAAIGVTFLGRSISRNVNWLGGIKGFLATVSLSIIAPGRLGDFSLPFYWKNFLSYGESLSVLTMDKIITLVWTLGLGSCAVYAILSRSLGITIGVGSLLVLSAVLLLFSIQRFRSIIYKILPKRIFNFFQGFINAFKTILKEGKVSLLITFLITGFRISLYGIIFWVLLLGLEITCPFYYPIFILAIGQLVSIIPISIMGIGTTELLYIFAFQKIGINADSVIAVSLLGRIITLIWLGIFFTIFGLRSTSSSPLESMESLD